ncbi:thiol-activated cytolysin family protein [Pedobacter polysacchareus]|uniref:thiol-activated cytolysin family protein n=1 Tax=Pedobacter polysacchareus TaxID=2861973 RepID=UPI001C98FB2A|nr:thiol-activated cytolysin family protein [Pedobacter polysacchareus]
MKKIISLSLALICFLYSCKKEDGQQNINSLKRITNENNQFSDLDEPIFSITKKAEKTMSVATANNTSGCVSKLHTQSQAFDKLSVLDPTSDILFVGSLLDANSIQTGQYTPVFLPSDYVRKPVTFSVSIEGSTGAIAKTIIPQLSSFREAMQEITNSPTVGQQPASFTFQVTKVRSKKEIEMIIGANLSIGSFFTTIADYNENKVSNKNYYMLKIFQKFFTVDIDIPQDGNLFNKPVDYDSSLAPTYVSSIDYGRSAYLLVESSYDSVRVKKSLTATFDFWKINGGGNISQEYKEVTDEMTISGTAIGGSSTLASQTINGLQSFHDYVTKSGNLTTDSRGAIIAYRLRNAKNHNIYQTYINGDYYTSDCTSQLVPIYRYFNFTYADHYYPTVYRDYGPWIFERIEGYFYKEQMPGTIPLYEYFNNKTTDHYYTTNARNYGDYSYEGISGYFYKEQFPGTVPLYEYFSHGSGDHFYTTDSGSYGGYTPEGIVGYIYKTKP